MTLKCASLIQLPILVLGTSLLLACSTEPANDTLNIQKSSSSAFAEGVPGGAYSLVEKLNATVLKIDHAALTATLMDDKGNKRSLAIDPEIKNIELVQAGDRINITKVQETQLFLRGRAPVAEMGNAERIISASTASKDGLLKSTNEEFEVVVHAVDLVKRQFTLRYPDGSLKTIMARPDITLTESSVGRVGVMRQKTAISVTVIAP
jgi:hypothetical protein